MPGADLALLTEAARAAGEVAMGFFRAQPERWDKPGGQGPVTEADLAVDNLLRDTLTAARPDYGWLSEETPDHIDRLSRERVFIVDPIDGTRAFIDGGETWSHSLAIAEAGRIIAAVVFLPVRDKLYAAHLGGGATMNDVPMGVSSRDDIAGASVLAAKPILEPYQWIDAVVPPVVRKFRPSLAYRLAATAEGRYDAMMALRATWEWDVAAGSLLVEEAGGVVTDRKGGALRFNNEVPQLNGIVAGGGSVQTGLIDRLL
ncbi:3'(2'),5'-bisphosphate nucleotidase CysQ [Maritimibacter sp. DP1N21-5]|uniref:3'(2'),5'-bisphosphate nucleotidase CysQ n=1 Tax=Maritimibacter sp. DP1N21-5 TaxID=2836867 RepID=UPI001C46B8C0|nr:3'(2'),5'-bisphosphate nucleotidase CysQ [Maritimibacter sp. DP1N21-5]MBV7408255.1 3'(2'),5'-bisphosphate nucleotidase CysQ [Maritimibacter sp. DP1N21-5]